MMRIEYYQILMLVTQLIKYYQILMLVIQLERSEDQSSFAALSGEASIGVYPNIQSANTPWKCNPNIQSANTLWKSALWKCNCNIQSASEVTSIKYTLEK